MSARASLALARALCALAVVLLVVGSLLTVLAGQALWAVDLVLALVLLVLPAVGALVAVRRPENPIGWLFLGAGLLLATSNLAYAYADLAGQGVDLPGVELAAWVGAWVFLPALFGVPPLVFLLFPDGHPIGPRWRAAVWVAGVGAVLQAGAAALRPGPLEDGPSRQLENPVGLEGAATVIEALELAGWVLALLTIVLSATSLGLRFARSRGVERLQLKWVVSAALLFALACVASAVMFSITGGSTVVGQLLVLIAFAVMPAAAGMAIARHRLYEIDRLINRTLVYGALTALLGGAYLGLVLLFQLALSPLTEDSGLAVAGSTLAVAALFRPARARIQSVVDRRFYRHRYDAQRTVTRFGARLRDEVELESLGQELRAAVRDTVQPTHVSLWIRGAP